MDCCQDTNIIEDKEFGYICANCFSKSEDCQFELPLYEQIPYRIRKKKFVKLILNKDLPWSTRESLIDSFDMIENNFMATHRSNFINLEALCHELLKSIGRSNESCKFKSLKTKSRIIMVQKFIQELMNTRATDTHYLYDLENIELVELKKEPFILSDKVINTAIYSDRHK